MASRHPFPSTLQRLRHALAGGWLGRWVLVAWAFSLGVAVAAPWMAPQGTQLVCSANGGAKWVKTGEGAAPNSGAGQDTPSSLDCPLCASFSAPLPAVVAAAAPQAMGPMLLPAVAVAVPPLALTRPPARAPPQPL